MLKLFHKLIVFPVIITAAYVTTLFLFNTPTLASDINVTITKEYTISGNEYTNVKYTETITNNKPGNILLLDTPMKFPFYTIFKYENKEDFDYINKYQLESLKIYVNNKNIKFKTEEITDGFNIVFNPETSVSYKEKVNIRLEYKTIEVFQNRGKVIVINIPENPSVISSDEGEIYKLNTSVKIKNSLGKISYSSAPTRVLGDYTVIDLSSKEDSKKIHRIIIGDNQLWKFRYLLPIDTLKTSSINLTKYVLTLPTDDPTLNQTVYYTNFFPEPSIVKVEKNGNLTATFYINNDVKEIIADGYAYQKIPDDIYGDYPEFTFNNKLYTSDQIYWEVEDPKIQSASNQIVSTQDHLDTIKAVYNFVVSKVDYDTLKLGINNIRQGAVATLEKGSGVCMEFSDLLITLLRSKNIPSRAVIGLGYQNNNVGETAELHQWAQAYVENQGWVSLDPTWGESTQTYIGPDLDHLTWFVSNYNINDVEPVLISGISYLGYLYDQDQQKYFEPSIQIEPIKENIDYSSYSNKEKLVQKYTLTEGEKLNKDIATFINPSYLTIICGLCLGVGVIIIFFAIMSFLLKRRKVKSF